MADASPAEFKLARDEYIAAIRLHFEAHAAAMESASEEVNETYKLACRSLQQKRDPYHKLWER
jgi:hypothetical protein